MAALLPRVQAERKVEDLDFTGDDFVARVNSDLIGKYVNIASRCAGFIAKKFDGKLASSLSEGARLDRRALNGRRAKRQAAIAANFERASSARRCAKSWRSPTSPTSTSTRTSRGSWPRTRRKTAELHDVCTTALILFRQLTIMLSPVLPHVAARVAGIPRRRRLLLGRHRGRARRRAMLGRTIGAYSHLMQRVDAKMVEDLFDKPAPAPRPPRRQAGRRKPQQHLPAAAAESKNWRRKSRSTTSPRSTCAWRRSSTANTSKVRTSCCA
jgi:methionyl-tRNA synthetase